MTSQWVYKVVPLPRDVGVMRKLFDARSSEEIAAGYIEKIMNDMAQRVGNFIAPKRARLWSVSVCLGRLLRQREVAYTYIMLVFRRQASE